MISRSAKLVVEMRMVPANYIRTEDDTLVFECGEYGPEWQAAYDQAQKIEEELGISVAVI